LREKKFCFKEGTMTLVAKAQQVRRGVILEREGQMVQERVVLRFVVGASEEAEFHTYWSDATWILRDLEEQAGKWRAEFVRFS
jgi:hypothetical protein